MPPIDEMFFMVKRKFKMNDWGSNVMEILLFPETRCVNLLLVQGWVGLRSRVLRLCVLCVQRVWCAAVLLRCGVSVDDPPPRLSHTCSLGFLDELESYSPSHLRCTTRGVLMGNKPNVFSGMKPAFNFRAAAYDRVGIAPARVPPKKLVVFNRENAGRRFENIDEMVALFKRYDIPYEILGKPGTFEQQVRYRVRHHCHYKAPPVGAPALWRHIFLRVCVWEH